MKVIAILTTILLQSVLASNNNVFDTEQSVAMNLVADDESFGPPSDGELLVVNSDINDVAANDENFLPPDDIGQLDETSVGVANDEIFGPPSDGELLVVDDTINSDIANDETFLPPFDDAKYFQIHSLYEVDGTQVCLQPRSKEQGSTIVVKPCLEDISRSLQWWKVDEVGQFRNKANPDLCMTQAPKSKLKLKPCLERVSTTKSGSFFIYNYFTNQIHYTRNPLRIVTVPNDLDESNIVRLVKSHTENGRVAALDENKVTKWAVKFL